MLPNFVVIGAQKSASTLLHRALMRHPHVFMPPTEIRFFEDPHYDRTPLSEFKALFDGAAGAKAVGIVRPDYLAKPHVPERIKSLLPDAKLVAVLRDPVERAVSAYFHQMKYGFIPVRSASEGLERVIDGEYEWSHPKSKEILEYGLYHHHLERYLEHFDRSQIFVLRFEQIRREPLAAVRSVCRFLDLDDRLLRDVPCSSRDRNAGTYSLLRLRLLQLRSRLIYEYDEDRTRIDFAWRASIPRRAAGKALSVIDRWLLSSVVGESQPTLSPSVRQRLDELYDADIRRLEVLLGDDLSGWSANAAELPGVAERPPEAVEPGALPLPLLPNHGWSTPQAL